MSLVVSLFIVMLLEFDGDGVLLPLLLLSAPRVMPRASTAITKAAIIRPRHNLLNSSILRLAYKVCVLHYQE